jgi:signal transduction histidine kinase
MLTELAAAIPAGRLEELLRTMEANGFSADDIGLADEAVALARATGDAASLARALSGAQRIHHGARQWSTAIELGIEAAGLHAEAGRRFEEWQAAYQIGLGFFEQWRMGDTLRWFEKAGALAEEMGDVVRHARCLNMTGIALGSLRNYEGADLAYERALALCDQVGADADRVLVLNNRAQTLLIRAQSEIDRVTASERAQELLAIVAPEFLADVQQKWPAYSDSILDTVGQCHVLLGDGQKAIGIFLDILNGSESRDSLRLQIICHIGIGEALLGLGRYQEAVETCVKFTEEQISLLPPGHLARFHRVLADGFANLGRHERALHHFSAHYNLYRRISNDYAEQYAGYVSVRLELEKSKAELAASQLLTEDLKAAKQLAENASRAKSEFLSNMSHELRTPLNAVIGFSELILRKTFGDIHDRYKEYVADIHSSGQHLLELINQLLDISKAEAGKLELSEGAVDLDSLIESSKMLVRERASAKGVVLEDSPASNIRIWADPLRIKQCLINLLSNAVEFSPSEGRVRVHATVDVSGLQVTVSDTGVGLAPEDVPKAFERFGQGGNGRAASGTGLGLPLTRQLIELHGGTAELTSVLGRGTRVTLRLPVERIVASRSQEADWN